jgi:hypothetical protein
VFVVLHNFLPHLFLNMNDASQVLDNSEIIAITSNYYWLPYSKFLMVSRCFRRITRFVKFHVHYLCGVLGHRFSYFLLFGQAVSRLLESGSDSGRINRAIFFIHSLMRLAVQKLVLQNHKEQNVQTSHSYFHTRIITSKKNDTYNYSWNNLFDFKFLH